MPARVVGWWERSVRATVCLIVAVAISGVCLAFLGVYRPATVVPATVILGVGLLWCWDRGVPAAVDPDDNGMAMIVGLLGIIACVVVHARYAGTYVFVNRDPGFFSLLGLDLARHGDLLLDGPLDSVRSVDGVQVASQAMRAKADNSELYVQGLHGHQAVIAPTQWIGGTWLFFRATALLGGAVLVVMRRVLVRVSSPWTATALTLALGASLPFAEFTRSPYSEITVLVCVLGALLALLEGDLDTRRILVVAVVSGTAMTTRIDSLLVISGFIAVLILVPLVADRRVLTARQMAVAGVGFGVPIAVGLIDGYHRSPHYVAQQATQMRIQWLVVGLVVVSALYAHVFVRRAVSPLRWLRSARAAGWGAGATVVLGFGYWVAGPWLPEVHSVANAGIGAIQEREGLAIDLSRTFGEQAMRRLELNFGTLLVVAAIGGAGLVVHRILRSGDRLSLIIALVALPSAPYLVRNSITGDMPWAMRRFLPVVIPVMLLLAAQAAEHLRTAVGRYTPIFAVLLVAAAGAPALALAPTLTVQTQAGALDWTEAVCDAVPDGTEVVFVTDPWLRSTGLQTLDVICDIDAVSAAPDHGPGEVARRVSDAVAPGEPMVFLTGVDDPPAQFRELTRTTVRGSYEYMRPTLTVTPHRSDTAMLQVDVVVAQP